MNSDEAFMGFYRLAKDGDEDGAITAIRECVGLLSQNFPQGMLLHFVAAHDLPRIIEFALSQGVDVDAVNDRGYTALSAAASESALKAAACLIENGADVNYGLGRTPTPVIDAVIEGHLKIVQLLISHGADVNASYVTRDGETVNPLSFAEEYGHAEIAALLREHGAVMPDRSGDAPRERTFHDELREHIEREIGPPEKLAIQETMPFSEVWVSVLIIPPAEDRPFRALVTDGVSQAPLPPPPGESGLENIELMIKLPPDWQVDPKSWDEDPKGIWPIHWLRMCAHAIQDNELWVGKGRVLFASKKVPEDWSFGGFLITPADLLSLECEDGREVTIYNVAPLLEPECQYARDHGVARFFDLWQAAKLDGIHTEDRPSIV